MTPPIENRSGASGCCLNKTVALHASQSTAHCPLGRRCGGARSSRLHCRQCMRFRSGFFAGRRAIADYFLTPRQPVQFEPLRKPFVIVPPAVARCAAACVGQNLICASLRDFMTCFLSARKPGVIYQLRLGALMLSGGALVPGTRGNVVRSEGAPKHLALLRRTCK